MFAEGAAVVDYDNLPIPLFRCETKSESFLALEPPRYPVQAPLPFPRDP